MTREAFTSNQKTYLSWAVEQIYFLFIYLCIYLFLKLFIQFFCFSKQRPH